ncbi:MAG: hypothetical protein KC443_25240 [Anaerolineales bacterium]|nr:hypothetical protein [Anaerolineales bacterium]
MTTLVSYHTSGGEEGRCDAKCYDAISDNCTCICGGANHGVGLQRAMDNTRAFVATWIEAFAAQNGATSVTVNEEVYQLRLPL